MGLNQATLVQGLILGIPYGLLAVGLVLVFKVSKFINFAQGAIGAFGGAIVGSLTVTYGVPYWAAFAVGVVVAAGIAAASEAAIIRRLSGQPLLMGVVITLLLSQLLLGMSFVVVGDATFGAAYPTPSPFPSFEVGTFVIVPSYTALLILGPIVVVALALVLRRTRYGLAVRATASNPDAAWVAGAPPFQIAGRSWAIAGGISAFSAILLWPTQGVDALGTLGPALLLRGLVAASIARFESITAAFFAGIGVGVVEVALRGSGTTTGIADLVLAAIALIVLIARPPKASRVSENDGNWTKLSLRRLPVRYEQLWFGRNFGSVMGVVSLIFMITVVPLYFLTATIASTLTYVFALGIVALSVMIITGRAGQLSLGQFAIAGIGATVSVKIVDLSGVFVLGPIAAMVIGGLVCLLLGVPALRTKGLVLAVTTLAFALATRSWILPQDWALGSGLKPARPAFGAFEIDSSVRYYFFALAVLTVAAVFTSWLVKRNWGRELVALRDNEGAARALGVQVVRRRVEAFLVAGALAGLGGSLLAHSRPLITPTDFSANTSIDVVVIAAVGGISLVSGPIIGAFLVAGVPLLAGLDATASTGLLLLYLVLVLFRPSGFLSFLVPLRDWWLEEWGRTRGIDPATVKPRTTPQKSPLLAFMGFGRREEAAMRSADESILEVSAVSKSYGGIRAVQGVSLTVREGSATAIIGPNGAGKTTFFEMISGFVTPDEGSIAFHGRNITSRSPEFRARRGIVRSFQNALLFPTLTVYQAVELSHGRGRSAGLTVPELLELAGLSEFADTLISDLPTGVRRVTELTCDITLTPELILLDEPSAGIAHSEIPALAKWIRALREDLHMTVLVVDHDMNLLRSVCDEFVAMDLGQVIARGTADEVAANPKVIEAFLGTSVAAVERSAAATVAE